MSLRYFSVRLYKNGRYLLRAIYQRQFSGNIVESGVNATQRIAVKPPALKDFGNRARTFFAETVLSKVTSTLNLDLRRKATKRLLCGDRVPFFALVGVSLATGTGILSKEDELEALCLEIRDAVSKFKWSTLSVNADEGVFAMEKIDLNRLTIGAPLAKGCSAIVFSAKIKEDTDNQNEDNEHVGKDINEFPLALKMMFNYDVESNAMSILRAMYREAVPSKRLDFGEGYPIWESEFPERKVHLPPHPNIVSMYSVFAGYIPNLAGTMRICPAALPRRLNPQGYGRNMSMFLLMKRYKCSLVEYLRNHQLTTRSSVLIFTQLLEAVTHINLYGIAHRDLKSDNILVEMELAEDEVPIVVVSDFGCCLADYVNGLQIPYKTNLFDKGGNVALTAPEIATQSAGPFSVLNYTKSDLWAVGTIAYEIFGYENPFYELSHEEGHYIRYSNTYKEKDLPQLGVNVPPLIRRLVQAILVRNPNKRPSAELAANICQLCLWAPSKWIKTTTMPSSNEIIQWLLCLTTKVLYEGRLPENYSAFVPGTSGQDLMSKKSARRTHPEYILISSFLARAKLTAIKQALNWIQRENL